MFQNENNVLQRDCFYLQTNVEMIQIEVDKEARNRNQHLFFIKNGNFYGRARLLSSFILSQLMCHECSSKTLEKSLSRDSQSAFGTGNGTKALLLIGTGIRSR